MRQLWSTFQDDRTIIARPAIAEKHQTSEMAGAMAKVVRVEQVMNLDCPDSLLGIPDVHDTGKEQNVSRDMRVVPADVSLQAKEAQDDASSDRSSLISATGDNLMPLPEGWPKIEKLQEKQSWDYSTVISPSVNKATSHLELLQTAIEDWFKESRSRNASRVSYNKPQLKHGHKYDKEDPTAQRKSLSFSASSRTGTQTTGASTPQLAILGVGGTDPREKKAMIVDPTPIPLEDVYEDPYLGAEEVMEEVVTLLAKLETDRTDTLASLKAERERVVRLQARIDGLCNQRLVDLPISVQKEHEDCAMDISELNWHVSYRGRLLERNNHKVSVADALNKRLKEEIAFINKHVPLVMEKLDLEVDAMDRIQQAQIDTNDELDITTERCSRVDGKSSEAHSKADKERGAIKKDLDTVKSDLSKISEELSEAKMTFNTYTHTCNDHRQRLIDNDHELTVLMVKDENVRAAEAIQATKVRDLETEIKKREFEHRTLQEENDKIQNRLDHNKAKFTKKEKEMRDYIQEKEESLRLLTRTNDELDMDVEDLTNKVKDCERQKDADEKNLERMLRELDRTEEQINLTMDDLGQVSIINNAVRNQLEKEEERCMQAEEALRSTTEALKKQVKEEIHSRTVLIARINTDSSDLVKTQDEVRTKKDLMTKKVNEVNNAVKIILGKVEKLRTFYQEKTKLLADMNEELRKIAETKKQIDDQCERQRSQLLPVHKKHKDILTGVEKKLDHMEFKTDMMTKKIKEMDESSAMMIKSLDKTTKLITQLQADLEELTIQIETGEHMEEGLKKGLADVTSRLEETEHQHQEHMKDRNQVLTDHEKSLEYNIALNRERASKYRHLQNVYMEQKNNMLDRYNDKIKLENAVKDLKQLKGLQQRMHTALLEYLKMRGTYNKVELKRMEDESHHNGVRVTGLQGQMDNALDTITSFLTHQLDGDTIRKMAMEKVEREEKLQTGEGDHEKPGLTAPRQTTIGVS